MPSLESLRTTITEIGGMDDGIVTILQTADDAWAVTFEDVVVEIEFDVGRNSLMLQTVIGQPSPARRADTLAALLAYNFLWRETGGVRLALAGTEGPVVQMVELDADVPARTLVTVVVNMAATTGIWRGILAGADAPAVIASLPEETTFLRV